MNKSYRNVQNDISKVFVGSNYWCKNKKSILKLKESLSQSSCYLHHLNSTLLPRMRIVVGYSPLVKSKIDPQAQHLQQTELLDFDCGTKDPHSYSFSIRIVVRGNHSLFFYLNI